ncbi:RNA binding protein Pym, putative [Cordyceps militaris CM01]|uniref:RNA binding protein Pym, putative n=1 Tax=Cordyceps militaris (strain CM01) TaxID=983644 RepID=G3JLN7_CORMM|nr:RNA binding protein Pym, putative [Cordyceps militaris CM01]EGX90611.1 RNA binding protein Pym, putative [Cordyceps militaris CM01]
MPPRVTNAGIVTDETSGDRHIPESLRADGTTRKAIKIRPGYRPAEDVELYRARNAVAQRERRRVGVPGAEAPKDETAQVQSASSSTEALEKSTALSWRRDDGNAATMPSPSTSAASLKNAKRREARKKSKSTDLGDAASLTETLALEKTDTPKTEDVDREVEREKRVRNLKKKLKQAKDLKTKKDEGQGLLPEQIAKVIKINELIRELNALGFDDEGEVKKDAELVSEKATA